MLQSVFLKEEKGKFQLNVVSNYTVLIILVLMPKG